MAQEKSSGINLLQYLSLNPKHLFWEKAFRVEYGIKKEETTTIFKSREEWDKMLNDMKNRPTKYAKPKLNAVRNFIPFKVNGKKIMPRKQKIWRAP